MLKRGDTVTFEIEVFNQGNVDAQNIQVTDYIPAGLELVATSAWIEVDGKATLVNPISSLAANQSTVVEISFIISQYASGSITNVAEISSAENEEGLEDIDSTPDDNPDNDGTPKDDVINENGRTGGDEDDHDIETINVCPSGTCYTVKTTRTK